MQTLATIIITFFVLLIGVPILGGLLRGGGWYTIVHERTCKVYVLFGKVLGTLDEPGFHLLPVALGWKAFLVGWLGRCYTLDMRLDQTYLRSQPVNSEEGAPMGIGIWYEMFISDPVSYIFKNADPQGSLAANLSNATVRSLSNMPLADMLEDRHAMSITVRKEVTEKSQEWGYKLGSVYIRKVHFRDAGMIRQIEEKVVNRLRQVTSAIKQAGANQVSVITSTAEKEAATEFARAQAMHPMIVGKALDKISQDAEIEDSMFQILEYQKLLDSKAPITLVPKNAQILSELLASFGPVRAAGQADPTPEKT